MTIKTTSTYDRYMAIEQGPYGNKANFVAKLIEAINRALRAKKNDGHLLHAASEAKKKMEEEETLKKRIEAENKKKEEDANRQYHERRSAQTRVQTNDIDEARRQIHQSKAVDIKTQVNTVIEQPAPDESEITTGYESASYLLVAYRDDLTLRHGLHNLIDSNSKFALIIDELTRKANDVHIKPAELLRLGKVLYSITPSDQKHIIQPLMSGLNRRIKDLIDRMSDRAVENAMERGMHVPAKEEFTKRIIKDIAKKIEAYISEEESESLKNIDQYEAAVDRILSTVQPQVGETHEFENEVEKNTLPRKAIEKIDNVWEKVDMADRSGKTLTVDELRELEREIYANESASYPTDVIPGSKSYLTEVNAIHGYTEKRLDNLAERLRLQLQRESPDIKEGITDPKEFLKSIEQPGYLVRLLDSSPEMKKLFLSTDEKGYKFRNKIFLKIHAQILTQKRESSNDNFGLYERADFTSFINLLRSGMGDIKVPSYGKSLGLTWGEWYTNLSNTIRHSRDIDFWASQPAASMDNFNKSLAMFQNEYTAQALSIPAVDQAYRAYETTLNIIRDTNDGYIPPALVEFDPVKNTNFWDDEAQNILTKMISQGVVYDAKRDYRRFGGLPVVSEDGASFELGEKITAEDVAEDEENLEQQMYMTLAKGFGMASMRFLEIISNSKVPGSNINGEDVPGFHSNVYEGITTALNYWNVFMKKWKVHSYKHFYLFNTVLPMDKKLPVDARGAEKAYRAWLDGTFEDKYGSEAKRMIDTMNFSRTHSALGPTTPWRLLDDTIGWTDKQRELMGSSIRILLAHRLTGEKVKEFLVIRKYKEMFRKAKKDAGEPHVGSAFEALWQSEGTAIYGTNIDSEWGELQHHHAAEIKKLSANFINIYKARMWVEMAMRNPLAIAHNAEINVPVAGYKGSTKRRKLNSYIIEEVLGIKPEDLDTGTVVDGEGIYQISAAKYSSPTLKQITNTQEVLDLEGDLIAVREIALKENRELKAADFNIIQNDKRKQDALKYWQIVREYTLGTADENAFNDIYNDLGITYRLDPATGKEMEYYDIDWHKIKNADKFFGHLDESYKSKPLILKDGQDVIVGTPIAFNEKWLDKDWGWIFSTDDAAFRKMAFLNLGGRQWVRRGGDVAAHHAGGLEVAKYMDVNLTPNPEIRDLAEQLMKIRQGYQSDDLTVGWRVVGQIAHLTSKLYEMDYKKLGLSSAQKDLWKTRRNVASWNANRRREFWDALEHIDLLPPHDQFDHFGWETFKDDPYMNIHKLRKLNHADNTDVWTEIITLGLMLAIAITLWRAFTAPSEEEGASGGGGGHR